MVRLCGQSCLTMDWPYKGMIDQVPHKLALAIHAEQDQPQPTLPGSIELSLFKI